VDPTATTSQEAEPPVYSALGQPGRTTTAELLVERSRRRTITDVLDQLGTRGGQFAERRADGSGWSACIPAANPSDGENPT
jgi:hypothetical protein